MKKISLASLWYRSFSFIYIFGIVDIFLAFWQISEVFLNAFIPVAETSSKRHWEVFTRLSDYFRKMGNRLASDER